MTTRLLLAAVALAALPAFAPAPFPKRERGPGAGGVALAQLQGTWKVLKLQSTQANGPPTDGGDYLAEVEIVNDRWSFVYRENRNKASYTVTVDPRAAPAQLDFDHEAIAVKGKPYGTGIIRRKGDTVELLYSWGSPRAASFEKPPQGYWLITLQRKR